MPGAQVRDLDVLHALMQEDPKQLCSIRTLQSVIRVLLAIVPIQGAGMRLLPKPDGIQFDAIGDGGAAAPCRWDAEVVHDDELDVLIFRFTQIGVLSGCGMPSNMFSGSDLFSSAISDSGLTYINLQVTTADNVCTGCEITVDTDPPDPIPSQVDVAPASFKLPLWVCVGSTALRVAPCANYLAEAVVALTTDKEDPECAGDPHVLHWTWQIRTDDT
jgi:hypothetical protein